jgi:hypothetical protein
MGMITSVHGTFTSPENSIFGAYTEIEGTVYSQNETWREFYTSQTDGKETYRDVYFGDGYYYLDDNGKKSVIPASLFSPDLTISPLYRLHHIEGNDIYDVLMQEDKNGTVKISAKIEGEAFSQKYKDNLAQTAFIISGGREISRILIHSADLTVAITDIGANKYVVSYSLSYSIDIIIDIGGAKFAVSVNALITVKNTDIGEIIPVPPPDGYAEYTNI